MSLLVVLNIIGIALSVLPIKIRCPRKLDETVMYRLIDVKLSRKEADIINHYPKPISRK